MDTQYGLRKMGWTNLLSTRPPSNLPLVSFLSFLCQCFHQLTGTFEWKHRNYYGNCDEEYKDTSTARNLFIQLFLLGFWSIFCGREMVSFGCHLTDHRPKDKNCTSGDIRISFSIFWNTLAMALCQASTLYSFCTQRSSWCRWAR